MQLRELAPYKSSIMQTLNLARVAVSRDDACPPNPPPGHTGCTRLGQWACQARERASFLNFIYQVQVKSPACTYCNDFKYLNQKCSGAMAYLVGLRDWVRFPFHKFERALGLQSAGPLGAPSAQTRLL